MNKKLIAAAVSAVVVPVASQADVTVYGNVTNAININGTGATSTTDLSNVVSRFGVRASSELGNGLTANGVFEVGINPDNSSVGFGNTRVGAVGLSGAFGSVTAGNQWSSYFKTFGTLISPTYSLGGMLYSGTAAGNGLVRTANTIKYANDFGPLHAELDIRLDETGEAGSNGDGIGLGLSFSATDNLTIAAAFDSTSGLAADSAVTPRDDTLDTDRVGIAVKGTFGGYWASIGSHDFDDNFNPLTNTYLYVGGSLGENTSWILGASDSDSDASQNTVHINHKLGGEGGVRLFYEGTDVDIQNTGIDATGMARVPVSGNVHLLGMRINF